MRKMETGSTGFSRTSGFAMQAVAEEVSLLDAMGISSWSREVLVQTAITGSGQVQVAVQDPSVGIRRQDIRTLFFTFPPEVTRHLLREKVKAGV